MSWIGDLVTAITSTFTTLGTSLTTMLKDTFTNLFFDVSEGTITGVSNFGIFAFAMMGISLCLGLVYFIVNMVRRKMGD